MQPIYTNTTGYIVYVSISLNTVSEYMNKISLGTHYTDAIDYSVYLSISLNKVSEYLNIFLEANNTDELFPAYLCISTYHSIWVSEYVHCSP